MKNQLTCKSCNTNNPLFHLHCKNCKSVLRNRIYNIDLWSTIFRLIHSPVEAFTLIIQSDHKNFISLLLGFASIKIYLLVVFLLVQFKIVESVFIFFPYDIFVTPVYTAVIIFLFSFLLTTILNKNNITTRLKDIFALISYSLFPLTFSLIFFFPVELILFGEYTFSNNPSPFIIKEVAAFILAGIEVLMVIWSIFLSTAAFFTVTRNVFLSAFISVVIYFSIIYGLFFFASKLL